MKLRKPEPNIVLLIWSWECGYDGFHNTGKERYSDVFSQILPHHPEKLSVSNIPVLLLSLSFVRLPALAPVLEPGCLKDPDVHANHIDSRVYSRQDQRHWAPSHAGARQALAGSPGNIRTPDQWVLADSCHICTWIQNISIYKYIIHVNKSQCGEFCRIVIVIISKDCW